jgi:hypothetical protein
MSRGPSDSRKDAIACRNTRPIFNPETLKGGLAIYPQQLPVKVLKWDVSEPVLHVVVVMECFSVPKFENL